MISGMISSRGVPSILLKVASQDWTAIVDTGFNGDLELPDCLLGSLNERYVGRVTSALAGGQIIEEDAYQVDFPFDGRIIRADATFVNGTEILIGTRLLQRHRLTINFVTQSVKIVQLQ